MRYYCDERGNSRGCNIAVDPGAHGGQSGKTRIRMRCAFRLAKWTSRTEGDDLMNKSRVSFVRCIPIILAMCSLGTLARSLASAQGDPQVGTWELNLAK